MEQQKLPNVTITLILSIVSFICCCCTSGFGGLVLSGIALFLAKKDEKLYQENPEDYSNYSQLKTAKIVAIIGLVLGVITVGTYFYMKATGKDVEMNEKLMEIMEELQNQ